MDVYHVTSCLFCRKINRKKMLCFFSLSLEVRKVEEANGTINSHFDVNSSDEKCSDRRVNDLTVHSIDGNYLVD